MYPESRGQKRGRKRGNISAIHGSGRSRHPWVACRHGPFVREGVRKGQRAGTAASETNKSSGRPAGNRSPRKRDQSPRAQSQPRHWVPPPRRSRLRVGWEYVGTYPPSVAQGLVAIPGDGSLKVARRSGPARAFGTVRPSASVSSVSSVVSGPTPRWKAPRRGPGLPGPCHRRATRRPVPFHRRGSPPCRRP